MKQFRKQVLVQDMPVITIKAIVTVPFGSPKISHFLHSPLSGAGNRSMLPSGISFALSADVDLLRLTGGSTRVQGLLHEVQNQFSVFLEP